jgi:hypothetical protein
MARWVTEAKAKSATRSDTTGIDAGGAAGAAGAAGAGDGHAAYFYRWTYAPKGPNGKYPSLAHHACEQPFVFHVLSETAEQAKEDGNKYHIDSTESAFSAAVVGYW